MEPDDYINAVAEHGRRLSESMRGGLDVEVGSCPGWDQAKLLLHIGLVHRGVTGLLVRRSTEPWDFSGVPRAPDGEARLRWYEEGLEGLLSALRDTPPETPVWTWMDGAGTAAFWYRRMAHEVVIHAWDGESAAGDPRPIPPDLAADGVDEMLSVVLGAPRIVDKLPPGGLGGTVHLHCTDTSGEWLVDAGPGGVKVDRLHAKGDVALRGPASDLDLFVWGRLAPSRLEVHGDPSLATAWAEVVRP